MAKQTGSRPKPSIPKGTPTKGTGKMNKLNPGTAGKHFNMPSSSRRKG